MDWQCEVNRRGSRGQNCGKTSLPWGKRFDGLQEVSQNLLWIHLKEKQRLQAGEKVCLKFTIQSFGGQITSRLTGTKCCSLSSQIRLGIRNKIILCYWITLIALSTLHPNSTPAPSFPSGADPTFSAWNDEDAPQVFLRRPHMWAASLW